MKHLMITAATLGLTAGAATAQTTWDFSTPWPSGNFIAQTSVEFADAVREATGGSVDITVHTGGEIGVTAAESLSSVELGIVQMASALLFLQAGEAPALAMDTLPYLIQGQEEMREFLNFAGPLYDEIAERHNQKILYYIPWPSPGVYSRSPIATAEDMANQRIRAFNAASFEFLSNIGASPLEMPWGDVPPALASGAIDGVATSSSSGVDGRLWQFTSYFNPLNWSTSAEAVTVNLDAWNALSDEERDTIEQLAAEMQPQFWAVSAAEDDGKVDILVENGITVLEADDSLRAAMAEGGRPMWDAFLERAPEARPVIEAYAEHMGK